jgi:hypothetical protein
MRKQADRHRREPDFTKDSFVYLNMKRFRKGDKLININNSPFKILEKEGNIYRLKLPPGMNINSVFLSDKLQKAADNSLPEQLIILSRLIKIDSKLE